MQNTTPHHQGQFGVLKGTAILSLGGIVAGLFSAAATPIYAHLYTPEQLGDGAIALAVATCMLPLTTWRLEYAIVNERNDSSASRLMQLCLMATTAFAALLFATAVCAGNRLDFLIPHDVLILLPVLVFALSFINTANFFFTRQQRFLTMGFNQVALAMVRCSLIIGLAYAGWEQGFAYGYLFAAALIALVCTLQMRASGIWHKAFDFNTIALRSTLLAHKSLVSHNLSTSFLNSVAGNLMPIVFSVHFTSRAAGFLFVLQQLIAMPAQIVAQAFWRTLFARLGQCADDAERIRIVTYVYDIAVPLLLMPVVIVMCLQHEVQSLLRDEWQVIASLLVPFIAMVFFNTLSNIGSYFVSFSRYRAESFWNVTILVIRMGAVLILPLYFESMETCIVLYLLVSCIVYFLLNAYWAVTLKFLSHFCLTNVLLVAPTFTIGMLAPMQFEGMPKYFIFSACFLVLAGTAYYRYKRTYGKH